ncbi:MAG: MoaD/ThiS family protein [Planctomycetia bacterium]|nr:MoaD/ThiS family protein [Planctomycetia bacterium]
MRIELFAGVAEAAGRRFLDIDWNGGSVGQLRTAAAAAAPAIVPLLARSAVAVDGVLVGDDRQVPGGAQVAVIPPVSGG